MTLVIRDLEQNIELDRKAMRQIVGGSARMSSALLERALTRRASFVDAAPTSVAGIQSSPLLRPVGLLQRLNSTRLP